MDEAQAENVLNTVANALSFAQYRTDYEARNSYEQNLEMLSNVDSFLKASSSSSSGNTEVHQLLSADVEKLKGEWDQKWQTHQHIKSTALAALDPTQAKEEWLKQLEKEEAEQTNSAKAKAAEKKNKKQQKLATRKKGKKSYDDESDSSDGDSEGANGVAGDAGQRNAKAKNAAAGMERGSSLLAHLEALEGGNKGAQQQSSVAPARSPTKKQKEKEDDGCVGRFAEMPFSFIPPVLLEGVDGAATEASTGTGTTTVGSSSTKTSVCHLRLIDNSPLVELTFTKTVCRIPVLPKKKDPRKQQKGKDKKKGPEAEPTEPSLGCFECRVLAHRAVIAAQYNPKVVPTMPDLPGRKTPPPQAKQSPTVLSAPLPGSGSDSSDGEMILEETPDYDGETAPGEEEEDGATEQQPLTTAERERLALEELSQQLVAQYNEEDQEEEEDMKQAKARDLPTVVTRSLSHFSALTESIWVVLMCHGGYFAGAVFVRGIPVAHKAFHRYVVRKKQGGKQSKHDKGGGSMSSAGGQIRRHHELKWKATVRDILLMWKDYVDAASMILYVAPGPDNRAILTDFKDAPSSAYSVNLGPAALISPVEMKDPRVRSAPLTTHRPTFAEVKRIYETVSKCTVSFYPSATPPE